ncbi:hypothetical protein CN526_26955 [Bacillus wiedmannii]|uniref:hypothetical protein n=1 Tax=Bacillus wiedmannii TaxID=1890302 RepID=UPI000BF29ECC|nr:hypothetical protein [Bacillus wiedmannii]PEU21324.1 hypothetical protein CN526_26955 [Bacillus wiedmannii]
MRDLDLGGLKSNWEAFKEFVQREGKGTSILTTYYFVFSEDTCGDEANVFTSHSDLDEWLSKMFWDEERYESRNVEDSMEDVKVWKLIAESEFKRLNTLYEGSRKTSIEIDGERYYRKLIPVSVEPTVVVSTNFY